MDGPGNHKAAPVAIDSLNQDGVAKLAEARAPMRVLSHPGMMSTREKNFLYNLTYNIGAAGGSIVDAGIFLGSSTKCFASAILDSSNSNTRIKAYDIGVFNGHTAREATKYIGVDFEPGAAFDWILEDLLHYERELIKFLFGDIEQLSYEGGDIAILFLDVMKNRRLSTVVSEQFFPHLNPNSVVIHQDYFHPQHPWIPAIMAQHSNVFEYVGRPQTDDFINTAVFTLRPEAGNLNDLKIDLDLSESEVRALFEVALSNHVDPVERINLIGCCHTAIAGIDRDPARALKNFEQSLSDHNLLDLASTQEQRRHLNRAKAAIKAFGSNAKRW